MRKFYPKPHFLPDDCEIPSKEYVFMGYDDGATMHVSEKYKNFNQGVHWPNRIIGKLFTFVQVNA